MNETGTTPKVCDYEGSTYQATFWDTGERAYEDAAEAIAIRRLLPKTGRRMLEIGAGAGRNTLRYKNFERIVLLDYSVTQLMQARERLGNNDRFIFVAADAYRLPFVDGLFDAATMIRVLHHMSEGEKAISEVHNILEPDGRFILEYANKLNLKSILRYGLKRQDWSPFTLEPIEFVKLNFNFHPKTTRDWLKKSGFSILRQLTVSHFRIGILKKLIPTKFLAAADGMASLTGDLWQLSPSVFVGCSAASDKRTAAAGQFFKCPSCQSTDLTESTSAVVCGECETSWKIEEGIYIFK